MDLWCTEQEGELIRTGFATKKVLFSGKSEFQQVDVIDTKPYGRMLLLDGLVMITDVDEFVYHEMISHIPMCLHPNPERVVVIGGGDGGTVKEILKYPQVKEVILCEIDELVVNTCREFFPRLTEGLQDPRVKVRIGDGVAFIKELKQEVDIVLVDSTDPIGPGEGLFSRQFYQDVAAALKPGGIMVAQSESPWFEPAVLQRIHRNISAGFAHRRSYYGVIPTYPRGSWTWTMGAQSAIVPTNFDRQRFEKVAPGLRYLTAELFPSVFALPKFYQDKITKL